MANPNLYLEISELIQQVVNKNRGEFEKFFTNNKLFDFNPGDYVKCTLFQGFFVVKGIEEGAILIQDIESQEAPRLINPEFLLNVELDSRWVKVLYEDRSRRLYSR